MGYRDTNIQLLPTHSELFGREFNVSAIQDEERPTVLQT
jgi:hypothetical protein